MTGIHTGCRQGTKVKLLFKDGSAPVVTKYKEEKSGFVLTKDGKFPKKGLRAMMIYKPLMSQS